jgi:5-methylcytosine-specific restriction protein B
VLDDLDRVDAVALLGECYALLDDRATQVILPYSRAAFRLPKNLFIIATSGTELSDPALRRRFPSVRLEADADLLARFLAARRPALAWLGDAYRELNRRLTAEAGARAAIGQGLFLRADLDEASVQRSWRFHVRPVVEAIVRDPARRAELELDALRNKSRAPALAGS